MPRRLNPRKVLIDHLKWNVQMLRTTIFRWNVTSKIGAGTARRMRRPDEYPENQPEAWLALARVLGPVIDDLSNIRDYAQDTYNEMTTREVRP